MKRVQNTASWLFGFICLAMTENIIAQTEDHARLHIESVVLSRVAIMPENFSVCYQYGCEKIARLSMPEKKWEQITALFTNEYSSTAYERALLTEYIARMEQYVGRKTKTQFDRAGTFIMYLNALAQKSNQMDCVDESINTLSYLKMLAADGGLKYHAVSGLITRGGLRAGYPHTAVLLQDIITGQEYVIDSWFYDNGRPAVVLPYRLWKGGWSP